MASAKNAAVRALESFWGVWGAVGVLRRIPAYHCARAGALDSLRGQWGGFGECWSATAMERSGEFR
eukprot:4340917-Alexandrium_andersonii.AAC.1